MVNINIRAKYCGLLLAVLLGFIFNANAGGLDGFLKFAQQGGSMTSVNAGGVIEDQRSGVWQGRINSWQHY